MPASGWRDGDEAEAVAIGAAASAVGVRLETETCRALALHARRVREENRRQNLTRIAEPSAMWVRHVADSLAPLAIWPEAATAAGSALDLGSGPGYPGLPLALAGAATEVVLLEATRKKAEFLAAVTAETGAPARAVWGRAEAMIGRIEPVARVWVRAVAPLPVLVELAFALLVPDGVLLAWKGPEAAGAEAQAGDSACLALGGAPLGRRDYELPDAAAARSLYAYRRGRDRLPRGVPRSPAVIRRRPLRA
jgi:16S rRNA (guanine527-N7)-methyltransferase